MSVISKIYASTYKLFKDNPRLCFPFVLLFLLQVLTLIVLYFSPRLPLRIVFGPVIRTFWGGRNGATFLHYPYNFILLPQLFQISSLALSVFVGALTSGAAIIMLQAVYNKKRADFLSALRLTIGKYMYLFIVVALWVITLHYASKLLNFGSLYLIKFLIKFRVPKLGLIIPPFLTLAGFILTVFIHSLLVYAIPVLIFEKDKLWKSILKSLLFFKQRWVTTLILVALPMLIYMPFSILLQNPAFLMDKFFPEFVAYVILLGVIVNFLFIDPLITISAALFYLSQRKEKQV